MRPFKRKKLSHDAYFTRIIYYIHRNPVHHRICDKIEDYKYSSYSEILGAGPTIVNRDTVLAWFSGRANFINDHMMIEKEYLEQAAEIWRIEE